MENCETVYQLGKRLGLQVPLPTGDLVCAFVGEWNAGKSTLLNALTGINLPARPTSTTKTVVRLRNSEADQPEAKLTDAAGEQTILTGPAALDALHRSIDELAEICLDAAGLEIPTGVVFVDTPGFNDDDQTASTRAATVHADIVVFVLQATGSIINQTQVDFISQVLLTKGNLEDIYFVVTHADLLDNTEQKDKIACRYREQFGTAAAERLFLFAARDAASVANFKQRFYEQLRIAQPRLLNDRRQRLCKNIAFQLRQEADRRRVLLKLQRGERKEDILRLEKQIATARTKEREQRSRLREQYYQRLRETVDQIRVAADQTSAEVDKLIKTMGLEDLQSKGKLQETIQEVLEKQFTPIVENRLQALMNTLQADIDGARAYSADLLRNLAAELPVYDSPLAKVSAESLLPLATIGSIAFFGWLSVPTLVLGYLAVKARDLGLTKFDRTGLFDRAVDGAKTMATGAYRQTVSMTVMRTLSSYRDQIIDYLRETVETVTEKSLAQINGVEALEQSYQQIRDTTDLIDQEAFLDQIDSTLIAYNFKQSK